MSTPPESFAFLEALLVNQLPRAWIYVRLLLDQIYIARQHINSIAGYGSLKDADPQSLECLLFIISSSYLHLLHYTCLPVFARLLEFSCFLYKQPAMAADKSLFHSLPVIRTSAVSTTPITNEDTVIVIPQAAPAVLHHNAGAAVAAAAAAANNYVQSKLHNVQTIAGTHNFIDGSARLISREPSPCRIPCTDDVNHTAQSCPPFREVHCQLNKAVDCAGLLQLQVPAEDDALELAALEDHHGEHTSSSTKVHDMQSPGKKFRVTEQEITDKEEDEKVEDGGGHQAEEEEGCVTPTARDQRIPQYNIEILNTSGLVCPPAPKKKPYASKRRRLFYSANDASADVNYQIVAERRAFLVDPPDLHNFPDCIRALFK